MNDIFNQWLPSIAVASFALNIIFPLIMSVFWVIAKEKLRQEFVLKNELQNAQNTAALQIENSLQKMISTQNVINNSLNLAMTEVRKDLQQSVEVQKELRQDIKLLISHASMRPQTMLQKSLAG